ncbi:SRPBCC family protein [Sphingobacterium hungaricum]|uniref:SRPBCC domain-containing protein n=1 Tax=Sphingobacterium hungaricum TaxID=2082723 RepID=A0A928YP51_9SPHI|nr:SRPBCC domain-containing protein [Sphingobacterium hungaricum]MBE8712574.1 SRPBCC domain-containing protein [Sphingobacterium hungaricum]
MNTVSIHVERTYNAPLNVIWEALTNKEKLKLWYFDIPNFKLEEGAVFSFIVKGKDKDFFHECTVTKVVDNQLFQHTWTHPNESDGTSLLTWKLIPRGEATLVRLTHEGVESFAHAGQAFSRLNYELGWEELLGQSLSNYLEKLGYGN